MISSLALLAARLSPTGLLSSALPSRVRICWRSLLLLVSVLPFHHFVGVGAAAPAAAASAEAAAPAAEEKKEEEEEEEEDVDMSGGGLFGGDDDDW